MTLRKKIKLLAIVGVVISSCSGSAGVVADYNVIPVAKEVSLTSEQPFILNSSTPIVYPKGDTIMAKNAEFLASYLKEITGNEFKIVEGGSTIGSINLVIDKTNTNGKEGYTLKVDKNGVVISSSATAGVFYGIQTLRKSLPLDKNSKIELPSVLINDAPRFSYRGMHLDVGRHFTTVENVKKFIDMLVLHNMNRFHWHLTEDQGWRIEIKKYPLLTEIGSKRKETVIGRNSGKYDGKPYGGYYTQEEVKDVIKYATDRHITIIPEIELPGHVLGVLAAYPELGCKGKDYEVWTQWGVSNDVLCAGNEDIYPFIEDVLTEVMALFPSEYIHIGADECPKSEWAKCPKCQAKIKELGIKADESHSKEEFLQSYIVHRVEKFLNDNGRKMIGWDEILEGGVSKTATVMAWRGEQYGLKAAKSGNNVIMTPTTYLYFDYYQAADTDKEPLAIGGYLPLSRVYSYEPMSKNLDSESQNNIIGVQANIWTEYMPTYEQIEYMTLPRMAALSEIQWSRADQKDYANFMKRIPHMLEYYDLKGYNYAKHIYDVEGSIDVDAGKLLVSLSTIDNADIFYTLDGTEPTTNSTKYQVPFYVSTDATVRAVAIRNGEKSREFKDEMFFTKATAKSITANSSINSSYEYKGAITLIDGLKGSSNYKSGRWIAYNGDDMDVTIDLGEITKFSKVSINTYVLKWDWIFDLRSLTVEVSTDGKTFTKVAEKKQAVSSEDEKDEIKTHELSFDATTARYIRVVASPEYNIPSWHIGAGKNAFVFVDEITVN